MPPLGPLRSDDGPACRVCGCTEHNACVHVQIVSGEPRQVSCSWQQVPGEETRRLCTACSGTVDDALEVIGRVNRLIKSGRADAARVAGDAFLKRHRERMKNIP